MNYFNLNPKHSIQKKIEDTSNIVLPEAKITKFKGDDCYSNVQLSQSLAPGLYTLENLRDEHCHIESPGVLKTMESGVRGDLIDIESKLKLLHIKNTKCPEKKMNLLKSNTNSFKCEKNLFITENTRDKKPCNDLSSKTKDRFHPLINDVQNPEKIHNNGYIGSNSRQLIKNKVREFHKVLRSDIKKPVECDCKLIHTRLGCIHTKMN